MSEAVKKYFNFKEMRFSTLLKIALPLLLLVSLLCGYSKIDLDPNKYKSEIEQFVYERTGQTLVLEGAITLAFRPHLIIEAENIHLKDSSPEKKELATAATLKITPSLRSLFSSNKIFLIEVTHLKFATFFIPELKTDITYTPNILEFSNNKIALSKGTQTGILEVDKVQIDTLSEIPKFNVKHQGKSFQLPLLLSILKMKNKIEGDTEVTLELSGAGKDLQTIKKSLSGQITLEVANGRVHGIDLLSSLKEARSLFSTVTSSIAKTLRNIASKHQKDPTGTTPFKALSIKARIENGILHHHHLALNHAHYDLHGSGKINLINNTLNYKVQAVYKKTNKSNFFKKSHKATAPLLLNISGNFDKVDIEADMDSYFKYIK